MSNQHTVHHNPDFTFKGACQANHFFEAVVSERDRVMDTVGYTPIPWKQIHRANIPHLARHST